MKRVLTLLVVPLAVSACGSPAVTKARLERALGPDLTRAYVERTTILGKKLDPLAVKPVVVCDRGGPKVADVGPGADWLCEATFTDDTGHRQLARVEVTARANATYVAHLPQRISGPVTITDARTGRDVTNPAFEWDGAFNPHD